MSASSPSPKPVPVPPRPESGFAALLRALGLPAVQVGPEVVALRMGRTPLPSGGEGQG